VLRCRQVGFNFHEGRAFLFALGTHCGEFVGAFVELIL